MDLCCISVAAILSEDVIADVLNTEKIGNTAWETFKFRRLSEHCDMKFFYILPCINLSPP